MSQSGTLAITSRVGDFLNFSKWLSSNKKYKRYIYIYIYIYVHIVLFSEFIWLSFILSFFFIKKRFYVFFDELLPVGF